MAMKLLHSLLSIFWILSAATLVLCNIVPPEGNRLVFTLKARGFQIYKCVHHGGKLSWTLKRAEAELYDSSFRSKLGFHYFLPKPDAGGGRATWSLSKTPSSDEIPASTITGKAVASISGETGNIDQLLVQATSHSGHEGFGRVSYVQRIDTKGGLPPAYETCVVGKEKKTKAVPYESGYTFWIQTSGMHEQTESGAEPVVTLFADGFQHYVYNGSGWQLVNATAYLSSIPGQEIVGEHFFLERKDSRGGQPTWVMYEPGSSSVTAKAVATVRGEREGSISWVDLEVTSSSGDRRFLGEVKHVERRYTRGGLPPPSEVYATTRPRIGETFASSYSAIYLFYRI